jgi:hypothetical protein
LGVSSSSLYTRPSKATACGSAQHSTAQNSIQTHRQPDYVGKAHTFRVLYQGTCHVR